MPEGFEGLKGRKPIVAMGASEPLAEQKMMADYFRKSQPFILSSRDNSLAIALSHVLIFHLFRRY